MLKNGFQNDVHIYLAQDILISLCFDFRCLFSIAVLYSVYTNVYNHSHFDANSRTQFNEIRGVAELPTAGSNLNY